MILKDLLENVEVIEMSAMSHVPIGGICFDTRKLKHGDLFVAVRGYEQDGHKYIGAAIKMGAACVICEDIPDENVPYVLVGNTRRALALICATWFGRPADSVKLIGVTGTNGKTTVTSLLKCVIEICTGSKVGLIGTSGNMIGDRHLPAKYTTPDAYELHELLALMVKEGCEMVVMEVSSHALFLDRVYGIQFDVGVFTNLTQDHMDFHGTMNAYAASKSILFANSKNSAINLDDKYAQVMIDNAAGNVFTYAIEDDKADLVAKEVRLYAEKITFCALTIGNLIRVELSIPGVFSVYNALAVVSASLLLGFDIDCITTALPMCKGVKGRAEVVPTNKDYTVIIDYAHTPDALEKIILAVKNTAQGRVVTLFGCGGDRDKTKRPLMGATAAEHSDFVIVTSDNPRTEDAGKIIADILEGMPDKKSSYIVIENRREAIKWALDNAQAGDIIILAGKGHETYQIIGKDKYDFDERVIVADFIGK